MNYILFDGNYRNNLLPFTYTRPVAEIRVGILKITEKWELSLKTNVSFLTEDYLSTKYPLNLVGDNIFINASLIPDNLIIEEINSLNSGDVLIKGGEILAYSNSQVVTDIDSFNKIESTHTPVLIKNTWDI